MQSNSVRLIPNQNNGGDNGEPSAAVGAFVETKTAGEIAGALDLAGRIGGIALIVGPSGVGKSAAIEHYAGQRERAFVVTMGVGDSKPVPTLSKIARALDLECTANLGAKDLAEMIGRKLGPGSVLVVDNAEHLPPELLLRLASFTERREGSEGCAVALVGRERLHSMIFAGKVASARFDMDALASRTGPVRYIKSVPTDDVGAFADAYGVAEKEARALLEQVAARPSAPNRLWALTRVLRLAHAEANGRPIRPTHVREAARALGEKIIGG